MTGFRKPQSEIIYNIIFQLLYTEIVPYINIVYNSCEDRLIEDVNKDFYMKENIRF